LPDKITLPTNEVESKKVLLELTAHTGLNAFSAEMTLKQWEKGGLKLEYDGYRVKW
jgi:hypothetical protein